MTKNYDYRTTWAHDLSRALNKARRGGLTKAAMMKKHGRFPRRNEWFGEGTEKEWLRRYKEDNPRW